MRADTEGKYEMGKRFATVIGVAAAGVMALGAQTALAGDAGCLGCPRGVDDPDLQLWGKRTEPPKATYEKQKLGKAVKVNVGCGDEACTVNAEGSLYWFEDGGGKAAARLASHEIPDVKHDRLKPASAE